MSGGSFNYASVAGIDGPSQDHYDLVAEARSTPGCEAVAEEAAAILRDWAALDARWTALRPVLKAIEWCRSGDWGEDDVAEALAKYNATPRTGEDDATQ